jgi:hypothetical protein
MLARAPYTPCKLYVDGIFGLAVGHYLRTPGGSAYLVQEMRQNSKRPYRRHLDCVRWPVAEIPADATVHELHWYKRKRTQSMRAGLAKALINLARSIAP